MISITALFIYLVKRRKILKETLRKFKKRFTSRLKKDEEAFIQTIEVVRAQHKNVEIDYPFQDECMDTLGVDLNNESFLLENVATLYRPSGQGTLINILNKLTEDIIFIKNIDNVWHQRCIEDTVASKKKLQTIGLSAKEQIDQHLKDLSSSNYGLEEIGQFI